MPNPIVFIPGLGFAAQIMENSYLDSYQKIFLDLPHTNSYSLEEMAIELANNMPNNSTLIAWSLGGLVSIKIATLIPEKVSRIIFLASIPSFKDGVQLFFEAKIHHFYP